MSTLPRAAKELILFDGSFAQTAIENVGPEWACQRRTFRALRQFRAGVTRIMPAELSPRLLRVIDHIVCVAGTSGPGTDLWDGIRLECEREFSGIRHGKGTVAHAVEWEILKLQTRLEGSAHGSPIPSVPLFRNRHVHIGTLIRLWRRLALDTEEWLASQGYDTLLDVGPWGGFNFVLGPDGYTRMPFARLTLAVGGLPSTPLHEQGGPLFQHLLPRYHAELRQAGVSFPAFWQYQHAKYDPSGRLCEVSGTHYLPTHSYERRTFIKVRVSRDCEAVEEIALQDFLLLLERLQFTTDWDLYREQTKDVDARFDLQDFISLNHMVEGVYQRMAAEDRLLHEMKDAFRGAIRTRQVLYAYLEQVVRLRWVENLYWALAEAALGVKRYQRIVSFDREVCPQIPPRLLIPVRRHLNRYHHHVGGTA